MKTRLLMAAVVLSGCTLGPNYEPPAVELSTRFVGGASHELVDASRLAWWQHLSDPVLNDLVAQGLQQNLDVRSAIERIVAAQENAKRFGVAQQVDGDLSLDARRRENTSDVISTDENATASATFVFDLFGEYRRGRERSLAELQAAEFDVGTVKLAYLSEIVSSYVQVRYFQAAAHITRQSIASRRQTLGVVQQRLAASEATQLELAQARSLLANAEADLPIFQAQARVNAYRIATLLDMPTTAVLNRLGHKGIPSPRGGTASGVPADLLRNRPDIRSAERGLAAATANVGVTEAQLYPSLRLAGSVTVGDADSWSFGPSLTIPILDQPIRRATRNIAVSEARQAELAYRSEIIQAVEDVQAALALLNGRRQQVGALSNAVSTADRVRNLSQSAYREGLITFDEVLEAERTRLSNQLDLALARSELAQAWVRLQVAVGKGWAIAPNLAVN